MWIAWQGRNKTYLIEGKFRAAPIFLVTCTAQASKNKPGWLTCCPDLPHGSSTGKLKERKLTMALHGRIGRKKCLVLKKKKERVLEATVRVSRKSKLF